MSVYKVGFSLPAMQLDVTHATLQLAQLDKAIGFLCFRSWDISIVEFDTCNSACGWYHGLV